MFDFLKKKATVSQTLPELFGLRLGGSIELNNLRLQFIQQHLIIENTAKLQLIQAVGIIQLDNHSHIIRYYTDDDGFFQFVLEGGMTEEYVNDGKLWYFYDTQSISTEEEWNRQLASNISQSNYELEGKTFSRLWQDTSGHHPPVAMTELTYTQDEEPSETDQFIMVYHRNANQELEEYLMLSGEETIANDQPDRSLVISTGLEISTADFNVIS